MRQTQKPLMLRPPSGGRSVHALRMVTSLCLVALLALAPPSGFAEIYKWKDKNGKWQYSDRPPADREKAEVVRGARRSRNALPVIDMAAELERKIKPRSPIETASLAVVSIETPLVKGSGFFITDDGYLLTNRHVVRPKTSAQWQEAEESVRELRDASDRAKEGFTQESRVNKRMKAELRAFRDDIAAQTNSGRRRLMQQDYDIYLEEYEARRKIYRESKREFDTARRAFEKAKLEFGRKSSASTVATNFTVNLKDQSTLTARLVGVSRARDLALLKVDGYKTPFIVKGQPSSLVQGTTVYAIGSPLGLDDSVTSGVVARVRDDVVTTDAKVLSGSSGGPLINPDGQVVGITTAKYAEYASAEGFGMAISIDVVSAEFPAHLGQPGH